MILGAVVAIIVIIAGIFVYNNQIAGPREDKASTMLGKGQTYFNNEMYDQALNGDGAGFVGLQKLQVTTAAQKLQIWPISMQVFAMQTLASGLKHRKALMLFLLKVIR